MPFGRLGAMGRGFGRMGSGGSAVDPLARDVFVFAGQSNMVATGTSAGVVPAAIDALGPEVQIWDWTSNAFAEYVPDTNSENDNTSPETPQRWGPEGEFARLWVADNPGKTCYLIKRAQGGTSLAAGAGSDWSDSSAAELFDALKDEVALAIAALEGAGLHPNIRYICWGQGESDALDATKASNYQTNLTAFTAAALAEWGTANTRMGIFRISDSVVWTFGADVRNAQVTVAAANARLDIIDTDDLPLDAGPDHYTVAGITTLGERFYDAYRSNYTFSDAVPAAFTFTDLTDQTASTLVTSNQITITDIGADDTPAVTFSGTGEFQVCDTDGTTVLRAWGTGATTVGLNQKIQLRMTTSASESTEQTGTLTVGGVSNTWNVTTESLTAFDLAYVTAASVSNLTTPTFSAQSFGVADATRRVIVGITGVKGANTTLDISGVTIGGVAATLVTKQRNNVTNTNVIAFFVAAVPTGTTGDVVITFNEQATRIGLAIWRLIGPGSSTSVDTDGSQVDPSSVNLDIPTGGGAIGYSSAITGTSSTPTGLTENLDAAVDASTTTHTAGTNTVGGGTTVTMGFNWSGGGLANPAAVFASWGPTP